MKFSLLFFIFILSISFCISANIEMEEQYYLGDNAVLRVSANFYDAINPQDIKFYRRHMLTSFENVKTIKVDNEQYITFKVPLEKIADNYSINMTVKEKFFGTYQTNEISKPFVVLNETGRFYIEENFRIVSGDYQIYVENSLGEEIEIKINPELDEESSEGGFFANLFSKSSSSGERITLKAYEGKFVNFKIGNETRLVKISFQSEDDLQNILIYEQVSLSVSEDENESESYFEENAYNEPEMITEEKEEIKTEEENKSSNLEKDSEKKPDEKKESENISESEKEGFNEGSILETCEEMEGKICDRKTETCEGVVEEARDSVCCLGECVEKKIDNSGKWVGWALLIIVLGSVGYAFLKSKQKKGEPMNFSKKN